MYSCSLLRLTQNNLGQLEPWNGPQHTWLTQNNLRQLGPWNGPQQAWLTQNNLGQLGPWNGPQQAWQGRLLSQQRSERHTQLNFRKLGRLVQEAGVAGQN